MQGVLRPDPFPDPEPKERLFQCSTCKRSFTRVDHLMRHVRAHTKQRPYVCPTCSKGFARVDLLKRHVANHTADPTKKRPRSDAVRQSRVVQACEACSRDHLRCEDDKPCSRCRKKNIACQVPAQDQNELEATQGLLDLSSNFQNAVQTSAPVEDAPPSQLQPSTVQEAAIVEIQHNSVPLGNLDCSLTIEDHLVVDNLDTRPTYMDDDGLPFNDDSPVDPLLPSFLRNMPPVETSFSGFATPRGGTDFSFNWDMDLASFDFAFLDKSALPDSFYDEVISVDTQNTESQQASDVRKDDVAVRAEAFKRSLWRYLPPRNGNPGTAEEPNLALPHEDDASTPRSHVSSRRVLKERLSYTTRDKLLSLVLSTSTPTNINRIAAGFPSLELLDGLIQIFLSVPSIGAKSWFHVPTFSPSELPPELVACIVAAGAVSTPDVHLQKLGLALQEASRVGVAKAFEDNNSAIRDLQHLRIQFLLVDIGMWSGFSRKMEIAESFLQPPITMLRRGGRFRSSTWKEIIPGPDDSGEVLQTMWEEWVLQESWLRLVYRYFELDRQSSMALLKPPLISYAEMQLPLPHSDALWNAPSPTAWKSVFLSGSFTGVKRPSLFECMHDLESLAANEMAGLGYLYMVWGMVWEYRQMATLAAKSPFGNSLLLSSRHQELVQLCEDFRVSNNVSARPAETDIILEVMLMHLNAPLEDMQTFAGVAGPEEAKHAYSTLRDWVSSPTARQALWHAAQILRASEAMAKGAMRNFYAMAIYHGALALWSYGLLKRPTGEGRSCNDSLVVKLNGDDMADVRRFVKLGRGEPALRHGGRQDSVVPLKNASEVISLAIEVLRQNFDIAEGPLPPLVENLVQLMASLRSATD